MGELSIAFEGLPQYVMTFSNQSYEVENYKTYISVALDVFNVVDFPFSKLLQDICIPGTFFP